MTRAEIVRVANRLSIEGRDPGPQISESSTLMDLLGWLDWCDPNGEWSRYLEGETDEDQPDLDHAWEEIGCTIEAAE